MHIAVAMFCTDYAIPPVELAVALETRGFESLWLPEHSHIPLSRDSAWPQGGELPKRYYDVMDPFVTLGAAAAAGRRTGPASRISCWQKPVPGLAAPGTGTVTRVRGLIPRVIPTLTVFPRSCYRNGIGRSITPASLRTNNT